MTYFSGDHFLGDLWLGDHWNESAFAALPVVQFPIALEAASIWSGDSDGPQVSESLFRLTEVSS